MMKPQKQIIQSQNEIVLNREIDSKRRKKAVSTMRGYKSNQVNA